MTRDQKEKKRRLIKDFRYGIIREKMFIYLSEEEYDNYLVLIKNKVAELKEEEKAKQIQSASDF